MQPELIGENTKKLFGCVNGVLLRLALAADHELPVHQRHALAVVAGRATFRFCTKREVGCLEVNQLATS